VFRKLLLGLALVWASYAALREIDGAVTGYDLRDRRPAGPLAWRLGMPPVVDLARFAARARPLLPAGSLVAFASPAPPGASAAANEAFFRYRWAAYDLPEVDLVELGSVAAAGAGYALSYRMALPAGGFEPVARLPDGWVYRVKRPQPPRRTEPAAP
jgi:hypothetical protein